MNTDTSEIETEALEAPAAENDAIKANPEKSRRPRSAAPLAFLALVLSLLALTGTAWMWWQDQGSIQQEEKRLFDEIARLDASDSKLSLELSQVRNEIASSRSGPEDQQLAAIQARLQADRLKLDQVEKAIGEQLALSRSLQVAAESMQGRLQAAEAAVTGMSTRELDAGSELDIAEIDYLLRLANERLKLFSDPVAADQALEVADMHLAALDNPIYLGVRQEIATARRELGDILMPDYLQIAAQLDSIQAGIANLPFPDGDPDEESAAVVVEEGWWEKIKGVFSNLVTIRRSTEDENLRISLQDKDYVRQRVWLQLEIAHLSLMRRDQQAFRSSLERVTDTLSGWFDTGSSEYRALTKDIDALAATTIQVDIPDITAPWSTLRMLKPAQLRKPPAPASDTAQADGEEA